MCGNVGRRVVVWAAVVAGAGLSLGGCGSAQRTLVASSRQVPVYEAYDGSFAGTGLPSARAARVGENKNLFRVEVEGIDRHLEPQYSSDSCWAACATAVLRHNGVEADQRELIRALGEGGAGELKLVMAVAVDRAEAKRVAQAIQRSEAPKSDLPPVQLAEHTATSDDLIQALAENQPVVIGIGNQRDNGDRVEHLRIVYAAEFAKVNNEADATFRFKRSASAGGDSEDSGIYAKFAVERLYCYDPIPSVGHITMTGEEAAAKVSFILSRPMANKLLQETYRNWNDARKNPWRIRLPRLPQFSNFR